jgi:hypothetical protein
MRGERKDPYKEDSTRGMSIINPLNYKGDVLVQVWVDSRILATLMHWLDAQGTYPTYMSQVVRRPLEVLTDVLVNGGDATLIDNTVEAREMLQRRFKVDLSRGGRGEKNKVHNITLSMRREDLAESLNKQRMVYDIHRPLRTTTVIRPDASTEPTEPHKGLFDDMENMEGQAVTGFKVDRSNLNDSTPVPRAERKVVIVENANNQPLKENMSKQEVQERMERINKEEKETLEKERVANEEFLASLRKKKEEKLV